MRQADVTSIDAIHAPFARILSATSPEAGVALDLAAETVTRTRVWLQSDQRTHWERELRQRANTLSMARQQPLSARLTPKLPSSTDVAKRDVHRAERAVAEAEQKLTSVRLEARRYDSTVASKLRELDRLRMFITGDGIKAARLAHRRGRRLTRLCRHPARPVPARRRGAPCHRVQPTRPRPCPPVTPREHRRFTQQADRRHQGPHPGMAPT